jgi:hypothetical protein
VKLTGVKNYARVNIKLIKKKLREYFPTQAAQDWLFAISSIFMVSSLNLSK